MKIINEINRLDHYSLKVLIDFTDAVLESMSPQQQAEWEASSFGVDMMHVKVRFYGLQFDNMYHFIREIPQDWAWQIVGELGDGYRRVTRSRVLGRLIKNHWIASNEYGHPVELIQ